MMIHWLWVIMMTHSVLMSIIWYMVGKLFWCTWWCTWGDDMTSGWTHGTSGFLRNCLKLHWTEVKANKILISEHDVILFAYPFFSSHVFPTFSLIVRRTGEINQKHHFETSLYVFENSCSKNRVRKTVFENDLIGNPPIRVTKNFKIFLTSILKDFRNEPYRKPSSNRH